MNTHACLSLLFLTAAFSTLAADGPHAPDTVAARVPSGETGFERDHLLGDWRGARTRMVERGVHFSAGYTGEMMGNVSGGLRRGTAYNGLLELSVDVEPDKFSSWKGATFHAAGLYPHGASPSGKFIGDLFVASNLDAFDAPRLFELWFEQKFASDRLSLRLGQLAADEEFAGTERGGLFASSAFGWATFLSSSVPTPAYPGGAPGARLRFEPCEKLWLQAAIYDGNPDPGDAFGQPVNRHGARVNLNEGALALFEIGLHVNHGPQARGLPGDYKLGAWLHTGSFADLRVDSAGLSLSDPASTGVPRTHRRNGGIYLAAEQMLWREPGTEEGAQGVGLFCRVGASPGDRSLLSFSGDAGVCYTGLLPGRNADECGLGVAWGRMGRHAREAVRDANFLGGSTAPLPDYEMALEVTYRAQVRPWWTIQPGLQYILHPGGSRATPDAVVVGLRTSIAF